MSAALVDTNVLLDLLTEESPWTEWSLAKLDSVRLNHRLFINDVVFAELSVRFPTLMSIEEFLFDAEIEIAPIPRSALFLAGKTFTRYRANKGVRTGVLPDFFIGAHAQIAGLTLLTRDARRYRSYFPDLDLITPGV